jgi:signal transduction histidine kinase
VTSDDGTSWTITVAASLRQLAAERTEIQRNVSLAFGFVGALGVACAALLTTMLVAPLRKLRNDVMHRWDTGKELVPEDYPLEVVPLVSDINELIQRNRNIHDRGRRQAADLAHALKTPSAALRNELVALSRKHADTSALFEALDRIDSQINRSLARMRAASAAEAVHLRADVHEAASRLERLFRKTPGARDKTFNVDLVEGHVSVDPHDLEEMLGNLLENAFKWCDTTVSLTVTKSDQTIDFIVSDDGPGIEKEMRERVLEEGARLDTSVPGTGIGLAIVKDLTEAYGGTFKLDSSSLGGLKCSLSLPIAVFTNKQSEKRSA